MGGVVFNRLLLIVFILTYITKCLCRQTQFTFDDLLNEELKEFNKFKVKSSGNLFSHNNIDSEMNDFSSLFQLDESDQSKLRRSSSNFNELYYSQADQNDISQTNVNNDINTLSSSSQSKQRKQIFVLSQNQIKDALDNPSIDTSIKKNDLENPLEGILNNKKNNEIDDPTDQQLDNMQRAKAIDGSLTPSPETQSAMDTKTQEQVLNKDPVEEVKQEEVSKLEEDVKVDLKLDEDKKEEKNISLECDNSVDDGIMNCENEKNQIRIEDVNSKALEREIEEMPRYEMSFYYGIVLCCLIIIVLLLARFRQVLSRYLEKYYIKSLRIIILDIIILMGLNTVVQIMYYNRFLDVIQLEYFNIYGFTITFAFFSIAWLFIATTYAFILQSFSNTYFIYEKNWQKRQEFIDIDPEEETDREFEERVKNIQYFLLKEDFIMPISHICYTEPMVLREDFNFAEYIGRAQAKCHLQLFNISLTTLLILITFFLIICLIDLIENWLIECLLFLSLPLISFIIGWVENRKQLNIIVQIITIAVHQYEIESIKFLNQDLKKPISFANKLKYPSYIDADHVYYEEGISRHMSLFPWAAVGFPLKVVHFTLVLQIVWIMVFLFNYSTYLVEKWECQLIFSIGLFLILFQLFFIIPFFLKKYAVNSHVQQLKDPQIIEKVIANQKEQVTLAFQRFYRLLKHLRRQTYPKRHHIKLRAEIIDQLKEIDAIKLKSIDELTRKLGFSQLQNDEYYYLDKAFTDLASGSSIQSSHSSLERRTNFNLDERNDKNKNKDKDSPDKDKPRVTANPRNQDSLVPQNQDNMNEEEQKDQFDSMHIPLGLQKSDESDMQNSLRQDTNELESSIVDQDSPDKNDKKTKSKEKSNESSIKIDKSEIDLDMKDKESNKDKKDKKQDDKEGEKLLDKSEKKLESKDDESQISDKSNNLFLLQKLLKICGIFTQEVILDPYKASHETLLDLFDQKQVIPFEEFKKVIHSIYNKIEQEKLNLILHIDDILIIINEVFYLEDKHEKIHLQRVASLIRNSIEMLPR